MPQLRFNKDQLIDALEARRPWAEQYDAKNLAEHRKAEKEYHAAFKAACREALKWPYEDVKRERSVGPRDEKGRSMWPPSCPTSAVASLDKQLAVVRSLRPKAQVTVSDSGGWSKVFWLLTHDENILAEVC